MNFLSLFRPHPGPATATAADPIDRTLEDRQQRLVAGIHLPDSLESIEGCLLIARGRGTWLEIQAATGCSTPLSESLVDGLRDFVGNNNRDLHQLHWLLLDLAAAQANTVDRLKQLAGRYMDRILAVAVSDPGLWPVDYDGSVSYLPLCHASHLAELTGVSVIDALPQRDLEVGGSGRHLDALPLWMLLGDRRRPVAKTTRYVLLGDEQLHVYRLPPSDGRDAAIPDLRLTILPGSALAVEFGRQMGDTFGPDVAGWLSSVLDHQCEPPESESAALPWSGPPVGAAETAAELAGLAKQQGASTAEALDGLLRSMAQSLAQSSAGQAATATETEWVLACDDNVQRVWAEQLLKRLPHPASQTPWPWEASFGSLTTAIAGLLHIDQSPVNVPSLTGASSQRVLGRLTPGRPSNWRQLIRSMSQYQPAPMKLRDAV